MDAQNKKYPNRLTANNKCKTIKPELKFSSHTHNIADVNTLGTTLNSKANNSSALGTTITLVDKGETNEGCIIFNTIS